MTIFIGSWYCRFSKVRDKYVFSMEQLLGLISFYREKMIYWLPYSVYDIFSIPISIIMTILLASDCQDPDFNEHVQNTTGEISTEYGSTFQVNCRKGYYFAQAEFGQCNGKKYYYWQ